MLHIRSNRGHHQCSHSSRDASNSSTSFAYPRPIPMDQCIWGQSIPDSRYSFTVHTHINRSYLTRSMVIEQPPRHPIQIQSWSLHSSQFPPERVDKATQNKWAQGAQVKNEQTMCQNFYELISDRTIRVACNFLPTDTSIAAAVRRDVCCVCVFIHLFRFCTRHAPSPKFHPTRFVRQRIRIMYSILSVRQRVTPKQPGTTTSTTTKATFFSFRLWHSLNAWLFRCFDWINSQWICSSSNSRRIGQVKIINANQHDERTRKLCEI